MAKTYQELVAEEHRKNRLCRQAERLAKKLEITPSEIITSLPSVEEKPVWIKDLKAKDFKQYKKAQNRQKAIQEVNYNLRGQPTQFRRRRKKI